MKTSAVIVLGATKDATGQLLCRLARAVTQPRSQPVQATISVEDAMFGMSAESFREVLKNGDSEFPEGFSRADRKLLIAADNAGLQVLTEVGLAVEQAFLKNQCTSEQAPEILRLEDAVSAFCWKAHLDRVWIQGAPCHPIDSNLGKHLTERPVFRPTVVTLERRQESKLRDMMAAAVRMEFRSGFQENDSNYDFLWSTLRDCARSGREFQVAVFDSWAKSVTDAWRNELALPVVLNTLDVYAEAAADWALGEKPLFVS